MTEKDLTSPLGQSTVLVEREFEDKCEVEIAETLRCAFRIHRTLSYFSGLQ